jgi:two-component system sensor histidine kinase YesM
MRILSLIDRKFKYLHLSTKLQILIFLSVIAPLIAGMLLFNNYMVSAIDARLRENADNAFSQAFNLTSNSFDLIQRDTTQLLMNSSVNELLRGPYADIITRRDLKNQAQLSIDNLEHSEGWQAKITIYTMDSNVDVVDGYHYQFLSKAAETTWYPSFMATSYRNQWVFDPVTDELSFLVRVCALEEFPRTLAILKTDISLAFLEETLHNALTIDGSIACIVDEKSGFIAQSSRGENSDIPLTDPISHNKLSYLKTNTETVRYQGIEYLAYYRSYKNYQNWSLIILVPLSPASTTLMKDWQWVFCLLIDALCAMFFLMITLMFSRKIVHRIGSVSQQMKLVQNGELLPLPHPKLVRDEISDLVDSYNYLIDELHLLESERNYASEQRKQSEMSALQAQMSPHFLYNTLEIINYYAFSNQADMVEKIVTLLARFYKLNLNRGKEFCTVWQELDLVESYFEIQNLRYNGSLKMDIHLPESLRDKEIPHIVLQPIVENAIRHGIVSGNGTGTIVIDVTQNSQDLIISVTDDGVGMTEERIHQINEGLFVPLDLSADTGSHYGVQNINERLRGYYGSAYSLRFDSRLDHGTTVSMRFPLQQG